MSKSTLSRNFSEVLSNLTSDQEQASVRLVFALLFAIYIYYIYYSGWMGGIVVDAVYAVNCYIVGTTGLVIASFSPVKNKVTQRVLSILLDIITISYCLMIGGLITAAMYGGYLWVAIANGLRFGRDYLYFATTLSIISFSIVIVFSDFWQQRNVLGLGLMVWLVLLPVYVLKLLIKLENAVVKADSANNSKSRFLANMSHEIRTPLTGIIGFAEILRDGHLNMAERVKCISLIRNSGKHLLSVINDILDISKIEENKIELETIEFNMFDLINDIKAIIQPQILEKQIAFTVRYDFPFPKTMMGDPLRIKQVLINLFSNAIKFTDEGEISIRLSYLETEALISIEVSDTGIGMTKEQSAKVFDAFQQADSTTTRKYGGTGLGLSLSKQLTEKMGGALEVNSLIGVGSTFVFNFPYAASGDEVLIDTEEVADKEDSIGTTRPEKVKGKILLAEDNVINQQLLTLIIGETGAELDIVDDGKKAIETAMAGSYDLIFMDMQMPVISGLEATRALRENGYKGAIVTLTANAMNEDRLACQQAGCDGFLTKPVDTNQLYQVIAQYLKSDIQAESEDAIYSELKVHESGLKALSVKFAQGLPDLMDKCVSLFQDDKIEEFKSEMHQLKGMGGAVGYPQITEAAGKLEFALVRNDKGEARNILDSMSNMSTRIAKGAAATPDVHA